MCTAVWFCNGTTHYCDSCHDDPERFIDLFGTGRITGEAPQCPGLLLMIPSVRQLQLHNNIVLLTCLFC